MTKTDDPDIMFRPSDNGKFRKREDGKYWRGSWSSLGYTFRELQRLGFRGRPFTAEEMEATNSIRIQCKVNGSPAEIEVTEKEWNRIFR